MPRPSTDLEALPVPATCNGTLSLGPGLAFFLFQRPTPPPPPPRKKNQELFPPAHPRPFPFHTFRPQVPPLPFPMLFHHLGHALSVLVNPPPPPPPARGEGVQCLLLFSSKCTDTFACPCCQGTLLRTSMAFGWDAVYLLPGKAKSSRNNAVSSCCTFV